MESEETQGSRPAGPEKGVRCELCNASLADEEELQLHMDGHAEKAAEGEPIAVPPRHACPFCPSDFETPEALKEHIGSAHGK